MIKRLAPLVAGLVCLTATSARGQATSESGHELYMSACAACHGPDGKGMPRSSVGFDLEIPDFTDCSFTTPEANADWFAVAHSGGPVRAFDRKMPAFGEALSDAQIQSILDHIRGFCGDDRWPRGELNLPRALVTEKAFPENELVWTTAIGTSENGFVGNELIYERRLGAGNQIEIVLPLDIIEQSAGGWRAGVGDVAIAFKRALFHDLARGSIVSAATEVTFPTGRQRTGHGTGVTTFEPFVTYGQLLPRDSFLQFQGGAGLSSDTGRSPHEAFWRTALGRTFFEPNFGRAWSPMIELLGARELESGERTQWDLVPQVQVSLTRRQHVLVSAGIQLPLNDRAGRDTRVLTYLLWDWFDGGFLSGWR
jgi:mono/diheme cytochrome c family protein